VSIRKCEWCDERRWADDGWSCEGCASFFCDGCDDELNLDEYDGSRWCEGCWPEHKARMDKDEARREAAGKAGP
jgi:hypothetical protein